jgi:hypothetical protein
MARTLGSWVQHISNPLHVYCRLVDLGMHEEFSKKCSIVYERYVYHYLIHDLRGLWNSPGKRSLL